MKPTNRILVAVAAGLFAGGAAATLPPPTAEEKAKTEKKAEETKAENEQAAKALDEAQNRIVRRYRAEHPKAMAPAAARELKETNVASGAKAPDVPHPGTGG
jgi:uncharacterized protein YcbK (DUF882 family)